MPGADSTVSGDRMRLNARHVFDPVNDGPPEGKEAARLIHRPFLVGLLEFAGHQLLAGIGRFCLLALFRR